MAEGFAEVKAITYGFDITINGKSERIRTSSHPDLVGDPDLPLLVSHELIKMLLDKFFEGANTKIKSFKLGGTDA